MAKYIRLTQPDNKKKMIKVFTDDTDKKGTWYNCTPAVYDYVSKNFKEGDAVTLTVENDTAVKVTKGGGVTQTQETSKTTAKFVCEDCGKELKDDKYKKCYTCNKKNPTPKSETKRTYGKSAEELEGMRKGNILNAISRSLIALQGHVDLNTIHEVIKALYQTYDSLTK